ncbi:MAG: esterase [Gammaproteobacteria bacterium]|nr:esterase [Gammaproteobacteria bacterium]
MSPENNPSSGIVSQLESWAKRNINPLFSKDTWITLGEYIGLGRPVSNRPITTARELGSFVSSRSSHVAQSALYGYLKTRAGTRFPELFENPKMLASINLAKWHIYIACISDLAAYMGVLLHLRTGSDNDKVVRLMSRVVDDIVDEIGMPDEAGDDFHESVEALKIRIENMDFSMHEDGDAVFSVSPDALYKWSPIADELKRFDRTPVKNSVRFRWKDVRETARNLFDAQAVIESFGEPGSSGSA